MANGDQNTKERPKAIMQYAQDLLDDLKHCPKDQQMQLLKDFGEVCFTKGWEARAKIG